MRALSKIILTAAFSIWILLIQGYEDDKRELLKPCKYLGMTKIEYGIWVTNCGDTVRVMEISERINKYDSAKKNKNAIYR